MVIRHGVARCYFVLECSRTTKVWSRVMFQALRPIISAKVKCFAYVMYTRTISRTAVAIARSALQCVRHMRLQYEPCSLFLMDFYNLEDWVRPYASPCGIYDRQSGAQTRFLLVPRSFLVSIITLAPPLARYPHCPCGSLATNVYNIYICIYITHYFSRRY